MQKKVLFIAYHFPPIGGSGVQRSLKFVKYMPQLNWTPLVCTVEKGHNFAYDKTLLEEIPTGAIVYRSNSGETLFLREMIENINRGLSLFRKENVYTTNNNNNNILSTNKASIKDKIFRYLEYNYFIPDTKIRWYKHAVKDIKKRILKNNNIDIIYSTSSPYTDHLIALEIKKQTNKPWIADFRDPWVGNVFISNNYSEKRIKKEALMERAVIENADKIIMVTDRITQSYKARYPEYLDKFITITNGFDSEDKVDIKVSKEKFIINYSGILTENQSPETLLSALEKLCEDVEGFKENLQVNFTGLVIPEYEALLNKSIIRENILISKYIPHKDIIIKMSEASINLVILADKEESKGVFTGKIFDYILANRPILGIMPVEGEASNLINNKKMGLAINHGEDKEVYNFIKKIYIKWVENEVLELNMMNECREFDRKYLTKELVSIMNELI